MQISLPILESFLKKNTRTQVFSFFKEEERILIGCYRKGASFADRSKYLSESLISKLKVKLEAKFFLYKVTKPCPLDGKPMKFVAIKSRPETPSK